jgi:hypothetical protein
MVFLKDKKMLIRILVHICPSLQKPIALTTFGRIDVQKYNPHDNRYIQPAQGYQITPAKNGQGHRLFQIH